MVIGDAIFTFDEAGRLQSFNAPAVRLFGYEAHEIIGQQVSKLVGESGRVGAFKTQGVHKDGNSFPVSLTIHALPGNGSRIFIGVARESALRARGYEDILNEHSLLLATLEATADGILVVDRTGKIVRFNDRFRRLWGIPEEVLALRDDDRALEFVLGQLKEPKAFVEKVKELYSSPDAESFDVLEFVDGRVFERLSVPQRVDGAAVGRVWSFRDVTDLVAEERRARRRLDRLAALWRLISQSDFERSEIATRVLQEGSRALGLTIGLIVRREPDCVVCDYTTDGVAAEFRGKSLPLEESMSLLVFEAGQTITLDDLKADPALRDHPRTVQSNLTALIGTPLRVGDKKFALVFASQTRLAKPFDAEDRAYVELLADYISRILLMREQDKQISYLAYHDSLTALANRAQFHSRLTETIAAARRHGRRFALVYIDLDRFKEVNDSLGHAGGDQILIEAARRLAGTVRQEDLIARLGGDEFGVLLSEIESPADAEKFAQRVCAVLSEPLQTAQHDFYLSASVGISLFPDDGETAEGLFTAADSAMYRAKEEGRDKYRFYSNEIALDLQHRQEVREGLQHALARGELVMHYQPVFNIRSGRVIGVEALMRWQHPQRGLLLPLEFIPLVEETNLMVRIGTWSLRQTLRQAHEWSERGIDLRVAVNLSARQFQDPAFIATLRDSLADSQALATNIELEITESVALRDPVAAQATIQECRQLGCRVVLDDFGTYYSSLSYLKKLAADSIKIDKSFVDGLPSDEGDVAIVRAVITLGRSLGREIIAEGVETQEQARWLLREGCVLAQGFLFARPMPSEEFERWLAANPVQVAL
ncbi:MAG: EAL domain-containing protein [Candidatus Eremiobacteraeota bacterium]|nr:EAL domain-containing protein [Candidatus Eremiobacteraeota bacterium]